MVCESEGQALDLWDRDRANQNHPVPLSRKNQDASSAQEAVIYRAEQKGPFDVVSPVWKGMSIIHGLYTQAAKRQVSLTATLYFNFIIVQSTGHKLEWQPIAL